MNFLFELQLRLKNADFSLANPSFCLFENFLMTSQLAPNSIAAPLFVQAGFAAGRRLLRRTKIEVQIIKS